MYADFHFYYQLDLVEIVKAYDLDDGMDPDLFIVLVQRLPDTSAFAAIRMGGEDWQAYLGWGEDRQLAAASYDMETVIARAAGNWAKKPPSIPTWDRPAERLKKIEAEKNKKPVSVFDIAAAFATRGAGRL